MGWEKGRYYTRSIKVNGRVIREYVGAGEIGEAAYQMDLEERIDREAKRKALDAIRTRDDELDAILEEFCGLAETLGRG
jgi:hypothetical protein